MRVALLGLAVGLGRRSSSFAFPSQYSKTNSNIFSSMSSLAGSHSEFKETSDEAIDITSTSQNWLDRIEKSIARSRKIRGGNYVQIATVDADGFPHCRTVVFRGFLKYWNDGKEVLAMKMITDARSEKVLQIEHSNLCEMVWWFSQSSEQYRLAGELQLVGAANGNHELVIARKQQWGNLSDAAREQFYWHSPGAAYSGAPSVPTGGRDIDGKVLDPPENFLLLLLLPRSVKYLRLKDNLAIVDQLDHENDASWRFQRVNP